MISVTFLFQKKQHRLKSFAMRNSTLRAQRRATVDETETPGFSAKNSEFDSHTTLTGKLLNKSNRLSIPQKVYVYVYYI